MNTFTDPHTDTYLTRHLFTVPTEKGGKLAIAVTSREANYLLSAYALFISGIVSFVWDIAVLIILIYYPTEGWPRKRNQQDKDGVPAPPTKENPNPTPPTEKELLKIRKRKANRYIALISIVNSSSPLDSIPLLLEHAFAMCFKARDVVAGGFDMLIVVVAFLVLVGSRGAGTIVPAHLSLGQFAPPKPGSVFYAIASSTDPSLNTLQALKIQQMGASGTQRAMGAVVAGRQELMKHVHISNKTTMPWKGPNGQAIQQITYDYKVTGYDFGLQLSHPTDFFVSVQGACTLEYGWFNVSESNSSVNSDVYDVYGQQLYVPTDQYARNVGGFIRQDTNDSPNKSYAIIPDTVGRTSTTEATDPWYLTEKSSSGSTTIIDVKGQRPVLSCWETNIWSYRGHTVKSVLNLEDLPGLNLPVPFRDEILPSRLTYPMIYDVTSRLGDSILVSSAGNIQGIFDASISGYALDLERLILAAYVATQNIFLDTTLVDPSDRYGLRNSALINGTMIPQPDVNKFVIQGNNVVALSPKVLVMVPVLWLTLWMLRAAFAWTKSAHRNSGKLSRLTLRAVAFQPVQLYRILDEELCGFRDDWVNRRGHLPYIRDPRNLHPKVVAAESAAVESIVAAERAAAAERVAATVEAARADLGPNPEKSLHHEGIMSIGSGNTPHEAALLVPSAPLAPSAPSRVYQPFAAPKVVVTPDGNYNLRFSGPLPYESHRKLRLGGNDGMGWSWQQDHGDSRKVVADNPRHDDRNGSAKKSWFRRYL